MKFFESTGEMRGESCVLRAPSDGQEWVVPARMLADNNKELWPVPSDMSTEDLRPYASEYIRRGRMGKTARPKVLRECIKCGAKMGARELRRHKCPK